MKNKVKANVVIDLLLFLIMLAIFCVKGELHEMLAYTMGGLLILHIALHWQQFKAMLKKNKWNRSTILDIVMFLVMLAIFCVEGELHETLAYTMGGLLILHIVLNWQRFKAMYRKLIPEAKYQHLAAVLTAVAIVAILTMPLYLTVDGPGPNGDFRPHDHSRESRY